GRHQKRRAADAHQLTDRGLDADLEQQDEGADPGQRADRVARQHELEERAIAGEDGRQEDPGEELAEHRRLPEPRRQLAAELADQEQYAEREQQRSQRISVGGRHQAALKNTSRTLSCYFSAS